jgi:hypothetical protein
MPHRSHLRIRQDSTCESILPDGRRQPLPPPPDCQDLNAHADHLKRTALRLGFRVTDAR